jgi:hypothetical protein
VIWALGLIDGVLAAKRQAEPPPDEFRMDSGLSLELLPADGVRVNRAGEVDLTLLRLR